MMTNGEIVQLFFTITKALKTLVRAAGIEPATH